jgi:hypothetical protein
MRGESSRLRRLSGTGSGGGRKPINLRDLGVHKSRVSIAFQAMKTADFLVACFLLKNKSLLRRRLVCGRQKMPWPEARRKGRQVGNRDGHGFSRATARLADRLYSR